MIGETQVDHDGWVHIGTATHGHRAFAIKLAGHAAFFSRSVAFRAMATAAWPATAHMKTAATSAGMATFGPWIVPFTGRLAVEAGTTAHGQLGGDLAVKKSVLTSQGRSAMTPRRATGMRIGTVAAAAGQEKGEQAGGDKQIVPRYPT